MSYTLEYNRVVYKDDNGQMILFIKMGDSNVYESQNNLRVRNWYLVGAGPEKEIWKVLGRRAGSTEGGILQRAVGWNESQWWKIEEYVKLYRSKISNARPITSLLEDFELEFIIEMGTKISEKAKEECENMIKDCSFQYRGTHYYNKGTSIYGKKIEHFEEMLHYLHKFPMDVNEVGLHTHFIVNPLKRRI